MKQLAISCALLGLTAWTPSLAMAQEVGQVLSRTALYQQVAVPRQICTQTPAVVHSSSGAGALMGAIAGGAMGNAVGDGSGRALATVLGIVGGAMVGDRIEGPGQFHQQHQTTCSTQTAYENRLIGYNVVYVYAGKQYSVQLPQDPGPTIKLNITPQIQGMHSHASPPLQQVSIIHTQPQVFYRPAPVYQQRAPAFSDIHVHWRAPHPVARHPSHRHPAERHRAPRHKTRDDRHHWR